MEATKKTDSDSLIVAACSILSLLIALGFMAAAVLASLHGGVLGGQTAGDLLTWATCFVVVSMTGSHTEPARATERPVVPVLRWHQERDPRRAQFFLEAKK